MRNILILGDSYSTFEGCIPDGFATYYPKLDVSCVEDTWWTKFLEKIDGRLLLNNSWSGTTIGYTGYGNSDCSTTNSFIYRFRKLKEEGFFDRNVVDTVFVFGGTNDSWANAPLGGMKFSEWEEKDLFNVLPAICYLAYALKLYLPNAEVVFIVNTGIKEEIQQGIEDAGKYYGANVIRLQDIDKENGHPTRQGMEDICTQVFSSFFKKDEA